MAKKLKAASAISSLPNILTYARIAAIPLIFCMLYSRDLAYSNYIACAAFVLASATDYFDGYLSRRMKSVSEIGRFLDPIADKLLVSAVLMALTQTKFASVFETVLAVVIISREIFVSGLREYLGNFRLKMPVSRLAKWKTASQFFAIAFLVLGCNFKNRFHNSAWDLALFDIYVSGVCLLLLSSLLTILTGWQYLTVALKYMKGK
ncbi:MAG: CDP-diacylglycerol--glycerol-3-phosphate 3-phosphatidyltransferase [Rickettsiales bacterium]|jgi:CDP-diacylglycerol--glycerol-3-phosphate 3-phosphatidyltransferase|nr:CDP-diacylglycerol--glycerol-3-phosphate 3-phosphatidyltransferase [Rickettsiales bacterium]